jgi:GntR family transcriptional regulator / MocR family aminotransferase
MEKCYQLETESAPFGHPRDIDCVIASSNLQTCSARSTLTRRARNDETTMLLKKNHLQKKPMGHPTAARRAATDPLFEIEIQPPTKGARRAADSIYSQLRVAILDGRLSAGIQLPPTRRSEFFFGISRNTALRVYEKLEHMGLVVSRHGSGSYIADTTQLPLKALPRQSAPSAEHYRVNPFWLRSDVTTAMNFWRDPTPPPTQLRKVPQIDFRPSIVDTKLFPFDVFRRASAKQLRGLERRPTSYRTQQGNQGNLSLREAVSRHIGLTRAVVCEPEDIVVTSGAQQAFDLLARVFVIPNETVVAFEDPGYPPMRVNFAAAGARLVAVGVDEEGLIVDQLPKDVGIIYVTPSHQFPLGTTMSLRRRKALIEFARNHGAIIIEDDYDGEFRYETGPVQALRNAQASDVVFYVGTFSKSMLPALRLGFVVAPRSMVPILIAAKNCLDWHCSTPVQRAVADFIDGGHLARHIRNMRAVYKLRRRLVLDLLRTEHASWLMPIPSIYGMHVAATTHTEVDLENIVGTLLRHNVRVHTFSRYYFAAPSRRGLIFGYGATDPAQIHRGLSLLRKYVSF